MKVLTTIVGIHVPAFYANPHFMLRLSKDLPCARYLSKLFNSNNLLTPHNKSYKVGAITIPMRKVKTRNVK